MTKTERMLALREWFNPDNYDALLDLAVDELRQEFRYRQQMYLNLESAIEQQLATLNQKQKEQIFSGHPILTASLGENKPPTGEHNLESDYHVQHFKVSWLYHLRDIIRRSKIVPFTERGTPEPDSSYNSYPAGWFWGQWNARLKGRMILHINLRASTDEEIVESVRYLLPRWRKTVGVKPVFEKQSANFGEVMIKKLIDYRIIPMLDLLYWSERNEVKLSDAELSGLIYRVGIDEYRGDSLIKETDKPLALRARTYQFENMFTAFLYKNRYLMDMKVTSLLDKINIDQKSKKKSRDE